MSNFAQIFFQNISDIKVEQLRTPSSGGIGKGSESSVFVSIFTKNNGAINKFRFHISTLILKLDVDKAHQLIAFNLHRALENQGFPVPIQTKFLEQVKDLQFFHKTYQLCLRKARLIVTLEKQREIDQVCSTLRSHVDKALEIGLSFEEIQTIVSEQLVNHIQKS